MFVWVMIFSCLNLTLVSSKAVPGFEPCRGTGSGGRGWKGDRAQCQIHTAAELQSTSWTGGPLSPTLSLFLPPFSLSLPFLSPYLLPPSLFPLKQSNNKTNKSRFKFDFQTSPGHYLSCKVLFHFDSKLLVKQGEDYERVDISFRIQVSENILN